ncbi:SIR2 family protein [Mucilaginibacter sp.]|uniref:SIR2 family protein n=1 Tax=Mucilaginibacter sp. TaxID=1882438 RepID=UPI0035BBB91D
MLDSQQKNNLIDIGTELVTDKAAMRVVLNTAGINKTKIDLNGAPAEFWENTLDHVIAEKKINSFLNALVATYKNRTLQGILEEIEQSTFENINNHIRVLIAERKCVLFLGPEFLTCWDGSRTALFTTFFAEKLAGILTGQNTYYDKKETSNLSYMINRYESNPNRLRGETGIEAEEIYLSGSVVTNYYEQFFKLNFPLIINTNPDTVIPDNHPNDCLAGHYDQSNAAYVFDPDEWPDDKTIVYNIFGSFKSPTSLLFTEKQAVNFARKAYERQPEIPKKIREIVSENHALFVGFDFTDWHFKILFDVLDLKHRQGNYAIVSARERVSEQNKEYYRKHYNLKFSEGTLNSFLNDIKQRP